MEVKEKRVDNGSARSMMSYLGITIWARKLLAARKSVQPDVLA